MANVDDAVEIAAGDTPNEWVKCMTSMFEIYEYIDAFTQAKVDYSLVPGSQTLMTRAWVMQAATAYMQLNMEGSCTLGEFLLSYKEHI